MHSFFSAGSKKTVGLRTEWGGRRGGESTLTVTLRPLERNSNTRKLERWSQGWFALIFKIILILVPALDLSSFILHSVTITMRGEGERHPRQQQYLSSPHTS